METVTKKRPGGRPAHQPGDKDRQMAEVLAGFAVPTAKIADVIGIDQKTLFKHYGDAIRRGSASVEAKLVGNLLRIASGTDGTALKAIMFSLQCRFGWSQYAPEPASRDKPLGKKEQIQAEAETAAQGTGWSDLVH